MLWLLDCVSGGIHLPQVLSDSFGSNTLASVRHATFGTDARGISLLATGNGHNLGLFHGFTNLMDTQKFSSIEQW
jgi:hypothetical protein